MPNRLIGETSPYLLQHAHNPVDWYPWGDEALGRAKAEDKPILLSIGYAACHWCHVMERECFEDPEIAQMMNGLFVNIKVDREERPDLDAVYMEAVQAMTGGGGWPLTVFLTPDGKAFFGGTYFPPRDGSNMPGFPRVLLAIAEAYRTKKTELAAIGERVVSRVKQGLQAAPAAEPLGGEVLSRAYQALKGIFDYENGGLGGAPKFPQSLALEFLLRWNRRERDRQALDMVELTLASMARGGIYDHLGGGFHRYSTDARWLVPHFEKMLYDNALLGRLYLYAYQATGRSLYRRIAEETVDFVLREMAAPDGGFCSSQDADTEGVEGKYYVWTHREIHDILGEKAASVLCRHLGVTEEGNFEGRNVLHITREIKDVAVETGLEMAEVEAMVGQARRGLLAARNRRPAPARDDKVLTSWNGLMLQTLAECAGAFGRDDYRQAAVGAAGFLLRQMKSGASLMHTYREGKAGVPGYLDDYVFLAGGLLAVHAASMQRRWLDESLSLVDTMLELFWDDGEGAFYDTGRTNESLVVRPRRLFDSPVPSGSAAAVNVLLQVAVVTGEDRYRERALAAMSKVAKFMADQPAAFGAWLCGLDFHLARPMEIVVLGGGAEPGMKELLSVVNRRYLPHKVLLALDPGEVRRPDNIPLLEGRTLKQGMPTAFVCRDYMCLAPVTAPEDLEVQLQERPVP